MISLFNKELSLFLSLSLTVTSELVVPGNSHGRDFLCSLQSPIGSLGRLPVGLGSLNEIPVPQDLMMMMFMTIFAGV